MSQHIWLAVIIMLLGGLTVHLKVREHSKLRRILESWTDDDVGSQLVEGWIKTSERAPLFLILSVMLILQVLHSSEIFSEKQAEELHTMFDLYVATIGVYDVVFYFIFIWFLAPAAVATFRLLWHDISKKISERGVGL